MQLTVVQGLLRREGFLVQRDLIKSIRLSAIFIQNNSSRELNYLTLIRHNINIALQRIDFCKSLWTRNPSRRNKPYTTVSYIKIVGFGTVQVYPRGKVLKKITHILPKNHKKNQKITENRKKKHKKSKNHKKSRKNQKISYTFFGVLYPSGLPRSIYIQNFESNT